MSKVTHQYGSYPPPPPPYPQPLAPTRPPVDLNVLIDALTKIREASLILIIAYLLFGIGSFVIVGAMTAAAFFAFPFGGEETASGLALGLIIAIIILILVGAILALYAVLNKLVPGSRLLATIEHEFTTASNLLEVGYKWGLLMMILGSVLLIVIVGAVFLVIGFILLLIGTIGLIILCFKFNDRFKNTLYLIAGILFIIGLVVPIVDFISWILLYVALGSTIEGLKAQTPASYQPTLI